MGRYGRRVSDEKMYRACVEYEDENGEFHNIHFGVYADPGTAKAQRTRDMKYRWKNRTIIRKYMEVAELDWQEVNI